MKRNPEMCQNCYSNIDFEENWCISCENDTPLFPVILGIIGIIIIFILLYL